MGRLVWKGDEVMDQLEKAVLAGIADAAQKIYVDRLRLLLSQDGYPPASEPGNPPHYRRGQGDPESLINSIMLWAVPEKSCVIVGSMAEFAIDLEFGTQSLEARPVWQPALIDVMDELADAIGPLARGHLGSTPRLSSNLNLNSFSVMTSEVPSEIPMGKANFLPSLLQR